MPKMRAAIFVGPGRIVLDEKPVPDVGPTDALMRITTTTICGTDVHILKGEYPVATGLTIGHEPVGVIEKLGSAVTGYREGQQRVIAGAITPSGHSYACLCGCPSQDGSWTKNASSPREAGSLATRLTDARPSSSSCPTRWPTSARFHDHGVDTFPKRLETARTLGANYVVDFKMVDPVDEIMRLTGGRGVDVAIEALGTQGTFEAALRCLRPGGTLSSLGVYSIRPLDSA